MNTYSFDGCGINLDGARILTGARADWDKPAFKSFCAKAIAAPDLVAALRAMVECPDVNYDNLDYRTVLALEDARAALAMVQP